MAENYAATEKNKACLNEWIGIKAREYYIEKSRTKKLHSEGYGFSSGHVWMWELDYKWDVWMASPTWCTWARVNSGSWWWTGRPGVLRFMGLQSRTRLGDWTELNWTEHRGDDRGWDGRMASLTRWTWVWVNSRSWWWTGRPGVVRFMGLQRAGHDWATELNWTQR